jgi:hypothetical protein
MPIEPDERQIGTYKGNIITVQGNIQGPLRLNIHYPDGSMRSLGDVSQLDLVDLLDYYYYLMAVQFLSTGGASDSLTTQ